MQKLLVYSLDETDNLPLRELDLGEGISIPATYKIADIKEPAKRSGAFTKTLKLPGTHTNNEFFGGLYDVNTDYSTFNPNFKTKCLLIVDGEEILEGYMQLLSIDTNDLGYTTYNVTLYDTSVDLWAKIEKKYFCKNADEDDDVDFSDLNHTWNLTSLEASWLSTWDGSGASGVYYPLLYNQKRVRDVEDFQPAMYHKRLLDLIMNKHGFTWSGTLKDNAQYAREIVPNTGAVKPKNVSVDTSLRVTKPGAVDETNILSLSYGAADNFGALEEQLSLPLTNESAPYSDPESLWSTTIYTAPEAGRYYFQHQLNGTLTLTKEIGAGDYDGPWSHEMEVQIHAIVFDEFGAPVFSSDPQPVGTTSMSFVKGTDKYKDHSAELINNVPIPFEVAGVYDTTTDYFELQAGWTVKFRIHFISEGLKKEDGDLWTGLGCKIIDVNFDLGIVGSETFIEVVDNDLLGEWEEVRMCQFLPNKLLQKDILLDVIARYNCYIYPNPDVVNDIVFDIGQDFISSGINLDWSSKKDNDTRDKIQHLAELQGEKLLLTYKKASDLHNKTYLENVDEIYGQYEHTFANEFVKGTKKIETPFEPTPLVKNPKDLSTPGNTYQLYASSYLDTALAPTVPALNVNSKTAKLRVLYAAGLVDPYTLDTDQAYFTLQYKATSASTSKTFTARQEYPYAGHLSYPIEPADSSTWYDINFGQLAYTFLDDVPTTPEQTLHERFWKNYIEQLREGKMLTASFALTSRDVNDIRHNPNAKVYVNNAWWRVNSIKFEGNTDMKRLSVVELSSVEDGLEINTGVYQAETGDNIGVEQPIQGQDFGTGNSYGTAAINYNVVGSNNTLGAGSNNIQISGNYNSVGVGSSNVSITGSNVRVTGSNVVVINSDNLVVVSNNITIIDNVLIMNGEQVPLVNLIEGGEDELRVSSANYSQNLIEGGLNTLRDVFADSTIRTFDSINGINETI